jgi:hypothetical protein
MSSSNRNGVVIKTMVLAATLGLAGSVLAAESDAVTTRTDPNLEQRHGRDSVYALSPAPIYIGAQTEPQRYGRAGGFVGTDRVEAMKASPPQSSATINAPQANAPQANAPQANAPQTTAPMNDAGRTSGGRFDHPDSAHGQNDRLIETQ